MCVGVVCVCAQLCLTFETPRNVAFQAPLSMQISRQEYWSGLPFPTPIEFKPIKWQRLNVCLSLHSSFVAMTGKKEMLVEWFLVCSEEESRYWVPSSLCSDQFVLVHESQPCSAFPNSAFGDIILVIWNWPNGCIYTTEISKCYKLMVLFLGEPVNKYSPIYHQCRLPRWC